MVIGAPVRGLRPVEAFRRATENVPKPTRRTSSPDFSAAVMASNTLSTAFVAFRFRCSALAKVSFSPFSRAAGSKPKRPVATYDRYERTREEADEVGEQGLFGLFLDLVETLGWRVSAICQLWASDLDRSTGFTAPHGRIRKRGEVDKEGVEMWVPMSESARRAVDALLERAPSIGDTPLFPAPEGKSKGRK